MNEREPSNVEPDPVARAVEDFRRGKGREAAFERLVEVYYRPVLASFRRRAGSADECLDLTQETFLRVYKGLKRFRGEAKFATWLFRIAHNVWLHHHQRAGSLGPGPTPRRPVLLDAEKIEDLAMSTAVGAERLETPQEEFLRREEKEEVRRAIEQLPGQMRRCMKLRIYQGLSYREIARILQLSVETVKVHLFRGRRKLLSRFDGPSDTDLPESRLEGA